MPSATPTRVSGRPCPNGYTALPLQARASPTRVIGGDTLTVAVSRTAPRAHVAVALTLVTMKTMVIHGHVKTTRTVIETIARAGTTDARGALTVRLKVTFTPAAPARAALTVVVTKGCGRAAYKAGITVAPKPARPKAGKR